MSMLADIAEVVIGVDTHKDTHTAAVVDTRTGGVLARITVTADPDGYAELVALAEQHSGLRAWALEGSGGYGAGLTRHLSGAGELVVELDRPQRPTRRAGAKSDLIDAERAARDALARTRLAQPKTGGQRAALQMLLTTRRAAVEASADAQRQLHAMVVTAPETVRARFRGQSTRIMLITGVGPIVAATVLTAWSHPGRCRNDAAFAILAGTAPIPASSGKTVRYRLNRSRPVRDAPAGRAARGLHRRRTAQPEPAHRAGRDPRRAGGRPRRGRPRPDQRPVPRRRRRVHPETS